MGRAIARMLSIPIFLVNGEITYIAAKNALVGPTRSPRVTPTNRSISVGLRVDRQLHPHGGKRQFVSLSHESDQRRQESFIYPARLGAPTRR